MHHEILIPYPSFRKSIACYTDAQLLRTLHSVFMIRTQICLTNPTNVRWNVREQWRMWHNWEQAFVHFGLMCIDEVKGRGLKYDKEHAKRLCIMKKEKRWYKPYWVNWPRFHAEHRALLVHYGECELFAVRLIQWKNEKIGIKEDETLTVRAWLEINGFPNLFQIDHYTLQQVNCLLDDCGAPPLDRNNYPNPYANLGSQAMDRRSIELPNPEEQISETWLSIRTSRCRAAYPRAFVTGASRERDIPAIETPIL